MKPNERLDRLQQELTGKLAGILGATPEKIDLTASIDVLGLDSLMLTELQVWITRSLGVNVPLIKLLKGPSLAGLSAELVTQLNDTGPADITTKRTGSQSATSFTVADLEGLTVVNPWLIRGRGHADSPLRLICFHSMGVGASLFTRFLLNPPDDYDIVAVQTPGRENRIAEPVAESVEELVGSLVPQLLPLLDRPVVIWGHSFGGIVAWEVIRCLRDAHGYTPIHFVVTGTESPHVVPLWQKREIMQKALVPDISPEYLLSQSRYVDNPDFFQRIIVPGIRRDMPLLRSYCFVPSPPLSCPITAFAARKDDMVYTDLIREWSVYTRAGFELIEVDGDHWFLDRNRELITRTLHQIAVRFQEATAGHFAQSATIAAVGQ